MSWYKLRVCRIYLAKLIDFNLYAISKVDRHQPLYYGSVRLIYLDNLSLLYCTNSGIKEQESTLPLNQHNSVSVYYYYYYFTIIFCRRRILTQFDAIQSHQFLSKARFLLIWYAGTVVVLNATIHSH